MTHWQTTILPKLSTDNRHKWGAILASILGSIASKVIHLAYEGYQVSFTTKDTKLCIKLWQ